MNFVVITAALSSMNTDVYLCSRMLFSLSRGGYAPGFLGRLSASGTPVAAIALSGCGILATAAISVLTPKAFTYLFGVALFRSHHRLADDPLQPSKLSASSRSRAAPGSNAAVSGHSVGRHRVSPGPSDHHGLGGGLEDLLDYRRPLALSSDGGLFHLEAGESQARVQTLRS